MNLDQLVTNLSALTLITLMLGMGLDLTFDQVTSLWRQPARLALSLVSVLVVIPLLAFFLIKVFPLHEADTVAILLASAVAGAGLAPKLAQKAGGDLPYAVSLMATLCLLAIVTAPLTIALLLKGQASLSPVEVMQTVLFSQLLPLFVGLAIATWWKALGTVIVDPVNTLANVLFPFLLLLILVTNFQSIVALLGSTGLLAIALLVVASLVVGHLLGGPTDATRSVLAITTAQRNLGLGILVAATAFPTSLGPLAAYGALQIVLCTLYVGVMAQRAEVRHTAQEQAQVPKPVTPAKPAADQRERAPEWSSGSPAIPEGQ